MNIRNLAQGALTAALTVLSIQAAQAATNVGVSVSVNQPGVYGRIDIGQQQPPLIYQQPVIIHQPAYGVVQRPIYLRVPPGQYKNWGKHCRKWNACNQPVYFVQEGWRGNDRDYREGYRDGRRDEHHEERGHGRGHGKHGH